MTEILNLKGKSNIVAKKIWVGDSASIWRDKASSLAKRQIDVWAKSAISDTTVACWRDNGASIIFSSLSSPHFSSFWRQDNRTSIGDNLDSAKFWLMHLVMIKICKSNREDTSCLKTVRINFVATIHPKSTKMSFWSNIIRILIIYAGLTQNFLQFFSDTKTVSTNFFTFWMYASSPKVPVAHSLMWVPVGTSLGFDG